MDDILRYRRNGTRQDDVRDVLDASAATQDMVMEREPEDFHARRATQEREAARSAGINAARNVHLMLARMHEAAAAVPHDAADRAE